MPLNKLLNQQCQWQKKALFISSLSCSHRKCLHLNRLCVTQSMKSSPNWQSDLIKFHKSAAAWQVPSCPSFLIQKNDWRSHITYFANILGYIYKYILNFKVKERKVFVRMIEIKKFWSNYWLVMMVQFLFDLNSF